MEDQVEGTSLQKLQNVHEYDVLDCGIVEREDLAEGSSGSDKREVILIGK